jgi:hypothetical protein
MSLGGRQNRGNLNLNFESEFSNIVSCFYIINLLHMYSIRAVPYLHVCISLICSYLSYSILSCLIPCLHLYLFCPVSYYLEDF